MRRLTKYETVTKALSKILNMADFSDAEAVSMSEYYPEWTDLIGKEVDIGFKFQYNNDLYRTLTKHTFAEHWVPGKGTESLYELIPEYFAGDEYDPIPYRGNMRLELGKHYVQNGLMYVCVRNSEIPVFDTLERLATVEGGSYVHSVDA